MVEITALEAKIIKQVEYYFGDINLARDKFMKEVMDANDGWISMETMLKFHRLKSLSDDPEFIKNSVLKSQSGLVEVGENGLRRNPAFSMPETLDAAFEACKDKSVYVKGFPVDSTLDEIIDWLETHGGKTLNVHMRRFPRDKKFKGSVFAIFSEKSDAEKFLNSPDAATYKGIETIRSTQQQYWDRKKQEKEERTKVSQQKQAATEANRDAQLEARMIPGALLKLTGLPKSDKGSNETTKKTSNGTKKEVQSEGEQVDDEEPENNHAEDNESEVADEVALGETPTVLGLKQWLTEKVGDHIPIGWIDVEPAEGVAFVRFRMADSAEKAWTKLKETFDDGPVLYSKCELQGSVLSGDEEKARWRVILAAQQHKAQKRKGARNAGKFQGNKRRRTN